MVRNVEARIFEDKDGYLILKMRTEQSDNLFKIHRLLLEFKLGRKLKNNEVTHHINENKQDNRLENLEVKLKGQHQEQHQLKKGLLSNKNRCISCGNKKSYVSKRFQNKQLCQRCYLKTEKIRDKFGRFKK